ncbi:TRAP transporter small permease [Bosea sp. 117]|uniref:TRAP transporter small permease n=1 Tax=Bosea sp. 117 TaxID=1125973 RepID=UPI00068CE852|nr:TRAP transporter small permease [Bosea sp. 117]
MQLFMRAVDHLNRVLRHLVGAMLGVMVVVVATQIVVRFVLPPLGINASAPWSEELARYLMIWCIFIGAAVAARAGDLIAVETLPDALPARWSLVVRNAALITTVGFLVALIWLGLRWVEFGAGETSTVMNLPMSWVYAALPIGSGFAIVNLVARFLDLNFDAARRRALMRHAPSVTEGDALV